MSDEEQTCAECGGAMAVNDDGITNHLMEGTLDEIDYDSDRDHVAIPSEAGTFEDRHGRRVTYVEVCKAMTGKFRSQIRFDREQLVFMVETILAGALDRVECDLPSEMTLDDREAGSTLSDYERGGLEAAVTSLGALFARITGDERAIVNALRHANRFDEACERLVETARGDGGSSFKDREECLRASGQPFQLADVYGTLWPDTRKHAEQFVNDCFGNYLLVAEPKAEKVLATLANFVQGKAELGKIEWDNDAPVFWGILEDAQAIRAPRSELTQAHRNFFAVEIHNELSGGVSPATLDSAVESLEQAPDDLIVSWCADESVTEATAQGFVFSIIELRDQFGGHVELRALIGE